MFKPNFFSGKSIAFRLFILSIFGLSIYFAFAGTQSIESKSKTENSGQSNNSAIEFLFKNPSENLKPSLLPNPNPTPDQTPHNLVGAFYDVQNFPTAKLLLNNKDIVAREIRPTLYSFDGQILEIAPVTVEANSFRMINLNDWASLGGENFRRGSIKLFHTGKDLNIGTQIYLANEANGLSFEERLTELGKFDSRRQESVWLMPTNQTEVKFILSNTSEQSLSVVAKLSRKPQHTGEPQTFTLLPHQTRMLDLRTDFADGDQFANSEIVGLTLEHSGEKSALKAHGQIKDAPKGYSNIISFSNPNTAKSSELHGAGLHLGVIGNEEIEPIVAVKNVGGERTNLTAKVPYTRADGTSGTIVLNPTNLQPNELRLLNMNQVIQRSRQEQIKIAGIEIEYDTAAGGVIVSAQSVSESKSQVFRVPMADPLAQVSSTGGYPWRIEETSRTVSYIKNMTDLEQEYIAYLTWQNGGKYMIGLKKIAPRKTIEIDVKKLRDEQTPDERGNVIPLNQMSGQIKWTLRQTRQTDNPKNDKFALIGRSEQIDTTNGISSSYACQNCCSGGDVGAFVTTDPYGLRPPGDDYEFEVGDTVQYYAFLIHRDCFGYEDYCLMNPSNWNSSNENIATVNSSGLVTILDVGDVEISTNLDGYLAVEGAPCGPYLMEVCENSPEIKARKTEIKAKTTQPTSLIPPCGSCESHFVNYHPDADITVRKVEILRNGQVISNPTSPIQTVVVGEKIELTTRLVGGTGTITNRQWTIPNEPIKNYEINCVGNPGPNGGTRCNEPTSAMKTDLTNSDLNQEKIDYYWWKSGSNLQVQFSMRVNGKPYSATAKFNILSPSATISLVRSRFGSGRGPIFTQLKDGIWFLDHGDYGGTGDEPGIRLRRTITFPEGVSGTVQWVQIYNISHRFQNLNNTWLKVQGEGVDKTYPYPSVGPNIPDMADYPGQPLTGVVQDGTAFSWKRVEVNDSVMTWVMFNPNSSNSIWIPLESVSWGWAAVAIKESNGTWSSIDENEQTPGPTVISPIAFPMWNKNVADLRYVPE